MTTTPPKVPLPDVDGFFLLTREALPGRLGDEGFAVLPKQVDAVLREVRRIRQTESRRAHVSSLIRFCRNELTGLVQGERTL